MIMSEEGGGKMRAKRSHGPSKPYERRKSFLGKMTDKVMEFIKPSWLTDYGSSNSQESSSSVTTEKLEDEDVTMTPQQVQQQQLSPQQHRPVNQRDGHQSKPPPTFTPLTRNGIPTQFSKEHLQRPGLHSGYASGVDTRLRSTNVPMPSEFTVPQPAQTNNSQSMATGFTSSQLPLTPQSQYKPSGDNNSDISNTTSGCSSMIPQPPSSTDTGQIGLQIDQQGLTQLKDKFQRSNSTLTEQNVHYKDEVEQQAVDSKLQDRVERVVTWTSQINSKRARAPVNSKYKPQFDVTLFGSPNLNDSSTLPESFHQSIYYPGKITFGGASAHRKNKLNTSLPYQMSSCPMRQKMKAKPVTNSSGPMTSSTAQKILESLEKMSTPLSDAKKIPLDDTVTLASRSMYTPTRFKPGRHSIGSYLNLERELQSSRIGPPTKNISVLSKASISTNHQKYIPPVVTPSSGYQREQNKESFSRESLSKDSVAASGAFSGKMKSKKFQQHQSSKSQVEDEVVEIPQLRTDFTLPVNQLPNFKFLESTSSIDTRKETKDLQDQKFSFSSPIQNTTTEKTDKESPPKLEFKFSLPIKVDKSPVKSKAVTFDLDTTSGNTLTTNFAFSPSGPSTQKSSFGASPILSTKKTGEGFSFGAASELKPGSVMDVLGKSSTTSSSGVKAASELKSGSVMDVLGKSSSTTSSSGFKIATELKQGSVMDVLGKGSANDEKKSSSSDMSTTPVTSTFGNKSKSVPSGDSSNKSTFKSLGTFSVIPEGSWTCDTCLIRNKPDVLKCAACMSVKPGSDKDLQKSNTKSNDLASMFKPKSGSWTCDVCLVSNKAEESKCVACQSPNPGAAKNDLQKSNTNSNDLASMFKPKSGSWTCDVCLVSNKTEDSKCVACQSPNPGAAKNDSASLKSGFGNLSKKPKGNWECDTCLVPNKADAIKCIACETPKPGSQPTGIIDKDKAGSFKISSGAFASSGSSAFTFGSSSGSASSGDGGGFKIGDSGKSTTEGTTGGFKFGDSNSSSTGKTASTTAGGFKFGDSNVTSTGKNVSSPVGGFKFGDSNTTTGKDASSVGGFKFGDSSKSTKNDTTVTGGFVFGEKLAEKSNDSGSLFGQNNSNKLTSESSKGDGFQFGNKQSDSTSSTLKESSTKNSFAIGQNNSNSIQTSFSGVNSDNSKTSDSTFKPVFGVTPSLDKPVENKLNGGDMVKTSSMFGQSTNTETSKGGFSFGSNLTSGSAGNSAPIGGFSMTKTGIQATETSTPFSLGSTGASTQLNFNGQGKNSSESSAPKMKRGLDDDTGPGEAKKPAPNLFQFGANSTTTSASSSMPVFGSTGTTQNQQPVFGNNFSQATTQVGNTGFGSGSTVTTNSGNTSSLFTFGAGSSSTSNNTATTNSSAFGFGSGSSNTTTSATPAASSGGFAFGAGNNSTSIAPAPNAGVFAFGGGSNTTSNTQTENKVFAFGAPNNSTTNATGNSGSVFNFTGQTTAASQQPSVFGMGTNTAATTKQNPVFGSMTASTTASPFGQQTPAQNTTAFGSSQNANTAVFGSTGSFGGTGSTMPTPFGTSGFQTGNSSTPTPFGGDAAKSTFGSTTFGSTPQPTTTAPSTGGFNFGTTQQSSFNFGSTAQPGAAGAGVFQFGANKPAETPALPAQPSIPATGGFNMNATSFGGSATPQPPAFHMGAAPASDSSRKIKRAVRKIRR